MLIIWRFKQKQSKCSQQMSSPKFVRVYKSPKNNSGKNEDPKPVQKKCQKSKEPMDKDRRQKQQLKNRMEEMSQRCKHLQTELSKERVKNQILQKQVKSLLEQLRVYKRENKEEKFGSERIGSTQKKDNRASNFKPTVSVFNEQKDEMTHKKQQNLNTEQTIIVSHPVSPKQKVQVGGYFGSLFN